MKMLLINPTKPIANVYSDSDICRNVVFPSLINTDMVIVGFKISNESS